MNELEPVRWSRGAAVERRERQVARVEQRGVDLPAAELPAELVGARAARRRRPAPSGRRRLSSAWLRVAPSFRPLDSSPAPARSWPAPVASSWLPAARRPSPRAGRPRRARAAAGRRATAASPSAVLPIPRSSRPAPLLQARRARRPARSSLLELRHAVGGAAELAARAGQLGVHAVVLRVDLLAGRRVDARDRRPRRSRPPCRRARTTGRPSRSAASRRAPSSAWSASCRRAAPARAGAQAALRPRAGRRAARGSAAAPARDSRRALRRPVAQLLARRLPARPLPAVNAPAPGRASVRPASSFAAPASAICDPVAQAPRAVAAVGRAGLEPRRAVGGQRQAAAQLADAVVDLAEPLLRAASGPSARGANCCCAPVQAALEAVDPARAARDRRRAHHGLDVAVARDPRLPRVELRAAARGR